VNIGAALLDLQEAERSVLAMQRKLHRWATADPDRRFDDLYNLVYDSAFLAVAWKRVRSNTGARTAGVDGVTARSIMRAGRMLEQIRADVKARQFLPSRVREKVIPKTSGKLRRLGIPTTTDRIVQASLKLVLEPIFEADFKPCSYGFRPKRRAQDAMAEIHFFTTPARNYEWVFEADIEACFDQIDHRALMARIRRRVSDRRVLRLINGFLKAGVLTEDAVNRETITGTPQGGILSPLLANIALSVLDEHFTAAWEAPDARQQRYRRRRAGQANTRLVRYADDFVVLVAGERDHAEALRDEVALVLAPIGLKLSEDKTRICHVDEGFNFLGWHVQRRYKRGQAGKKGIYTYPSKEALLSVMDKVRHLTRRRRHRLLVNLIGALNPLLRGWCNYFRHGVSKQTFKYLDHFVFWRTVQWIRKRRVGVTWGTMRRRLLPNWKVSDGGIELFRAEQVAVTRYRYRGAQIPTIWSSSTA
jgi:RNA-directed DNA polymerase